MPGNGSKRATARVCQARRDGLGTRPRRRGVARRRSRSRARPRPSPRLREAGEEVVFVHQPLEPAGGARSRRSWLATASRPTGDVLTSAMAAAHARASRASACCVCAGPGVVEALERAGRDAGARRRRRRGGRRASTSTSTTTRLRRAAPAVRDGARLIGTNDDPTYPDPGRADPGRRRDPRRGGRRPRASTPVVAGKPYAPDGRPGAGAAGRRRHGGGRPRRHRRRAWPDARLPLRPRAQRLDRPARRRLGADAGRRRPRTWPTVVAAELGSGRGRSSA